MYGYRTKHKILTAYLKRLQKDVLNGQDLDIAHTVLMKEFARELGKKEPRSGYIMQQMSNLTLEGYLHITQNKEKNDMNLSITGQGINAVMSNLFKIKQHNWFWKAFMNTVMTIANVAVAVTAVWALTKDNDEVQRIEERVNKLEKAKEVKEVKANPNIQQTKNGYLTNPKDTLNTSK